MKNLLPLLIGALANDQVAPVVAETAGDGYNVALDNAAALDDDGWALIAPFGRHPKVHQFRGPDGTVKQQKFIQVLDNASADSLAGKENSFFGRIKRALVGIPIYKGHGDLNDLMPNAVSNTTEKIKLGVVDQVRKTDKGIEAHFALDNDGAKAVGEGWKYPSGFWFIKAIGNEGDAIVCNPTKLISVALTPFPNISGVDSLANARSTTDSEPNNTNKNTDMKLIAGWLLAQGVALANSENPTETQILDGLKTVLTSKTGEVVALGNEKSTLTGKLTALENEKTSLTTRATQAETALANEQTARKAERRRAAEAVADLAIHRGYKTVAERDTVITALENSADFKKDSDALFAGQPTTKVTGTNVESGKQQAALSNEQVALTNEYQAAFQAELIATGQNPTKAHQNIMTLPKYQGLAAKLAPKARA